MKNIKLNEYFCQVKIAWISDIFFFRAYCNPIKLKNSCLLLKTDDIFSSAFGFWFFLTLFKEIIYKTLFYKSSRKTWGQNELNLNTVVFRKANELQYVLNVTTQRKQFFVLDRLLHKLLYHWNIQPNREKKFIKNAAQVKSMHISVSNLKADDIKQPVLAQFHNTFFDSPYFTHCLKFSPKYQHLIYFFISFFRIA